MRARTPARNADPGRPARGFRPFPHGAAIVVAATALALAAALEPVVWTACERLALTPGGLRQGRTWTLLTYALAPAAPAHQAAGTVLLLIFAGILGRAVGPRATMRRLLWSIPLLGICTIPGVLALGVPYRGPVGLALALGCAAALQSHDPGWTLLGGRVRTWHLLTVGSATILGPDIVRGSPDTLLQLAALPVGLAAVVVPPALRRTGRQMRLARLEREIRLHHEAHQTVDALLARIGDGGVKALSRRERATLRRLARFYAPPVREEPAGPATAETPARTYPDADVLRRRLDDLLLKIHRQGTRSLTDDERRLLLEASEHFRRRTGP